MEKVTINFVDKRLDQAKQELITEILEKGLEHKPETFNSNTTVWIWQSYINLKRHSHIDVRLSTALDKNCINVAHRSGLKETDFYDHFVVAIRSDRHACFQADIEVLQNASSVWKSNDFHLPHWPQPGLKKKTRSRTNVGTVAYYGKEDHLEEAFKSDAFANGLRELKCELNIQEDEWWDYSGTDVVLAIRDGHKFYLDCKPASKLINAWTAGCPAILSTEAAYLELRQSDLDFIEANTPEEVLTAIKELQCNEELYNRMVENGLLRAQDYAVEKTVERWEHFLSAYALPRFIKWKSKKRHPLVRLARKLLDRSRAISLGWHATRYPKHKIRLVLSYIRISIAIPKFLVLQARPARDRGG